MILGITTDRAGEITVRTTTKDGSAGPRREISALDATTDLRVEVPTREEIRTVTVSLGDIACSVARVTR